MAVIERKHYPVRIPSLGRFYDLELQDGVVEVHAIRVFEEKMMSSGIGSPNDRINRMIGSCLKTPIPVENLLLVDRFFLLFQLAALSYTPTRDLNVKCPNCKEGVEKTVDLSKDFQVHYLDEDVEEPIEVELPVSKHKVSLKFLRVKDENEVLALAEKLRKPVAFSEKKRKQHGLGKDDIYTVRLVSSVVSVDGKEMTVEEKVAWANNLEGQDSDTLRNAFDDYDFGVDPVFQVRCPNCQEAFQSILPPDEFFRL